MKNLNRYLEHTNIKFDAKRNDIRKLCKEASQYRFRSVVVFPEWVYYCRELLQETSVKVIQILNFPHQKANNIRDDVDEVDVFVDFRMCDSHRVRRLIETKLMILANQIKKPVKIVIETHNLTNRELALACKLVKKYGFAYVKSSTGLFQKRRRAGMDLALIKRAIWFPVLAFTRKGIRPFIKIPISTPVLWISQYLFRLRGFTLRLPYLRIKSPKIKISGGVSTRHDAETLVRHGASLIGASKSVAIIENKKECSLCKGLGQVGKNPDIPCPECQKKHGE